MHTLKSIYCRTFQTALKIALPFLPYRTPKIVGSVKKLLEIIQQEECSSVLLITDAQITKLGLTKRLEQSFCNAGISYTIYDKTVANPTTTNVAEALEPVSYTHLDVYKRQALAPAPTGSRSSTCPSSCAFFPAKNIALILF